MSKPTEKKLNAELISYQLGEIQKDLLDLKSQNISRTEFELRVGRVEKLVYGAIGLGLLALGKALVELVVK